MSFTVGVRKETKPQERRVSLRPQELFDVVAKAGNDKIFLVESGAGTGSGIDDSLYTSVGAKVVPFRTASAAEIFASSNLVQGVKEPLPAEFPFIKNGQIHYTFFHFPSGKELLYALMKKNVTAIAYEAIEEADGSRPILAGMSDTASEFSIRMAKKYYVEATGKPWNRCVVLVFGAKGVYGKTSMRRAMTRGAFTVGFDLNAEENEATACMSGCGHICPSLLNKLHGQIVRPTDALMKALLPYADVLMMGAAARNKPAPKILTKEWFAYVKQGAIITDASVDEGGCTVLRLDGEGRSKPTSHIEPVVTEMVDGKSVLYCGVPNMPGGIPEMATELISTTSSKYLPQILKHVNPDNTFNKSLMAETALVKGFALYQGKIVDPYIAGLFGETYIPLESLLR